jgi:F0F1-type ATP synthase membrane subunit b/b'
VISPRARRLKSLAGVFGFLCFVLAMAAPALAQENEPSPADSPAGSVFRWINFAIVFLGIAWALSKAGPHFRGHAEEISEKIAEGTRAREAAEQKQREAQAKLAGIDTEVTAMREDAKRAAQGEAERLRAMAKVEAETIERSAQAEIAAAERAARLELKFLAARTAIERAEAVLRKELTPQAESAIFRTFVAELERSPN